ncbi:MAG: hypothetical protein Kow006_11480 [Gammaproteobacteria bacterium]
MRKLAIVFLLSLFAGGGCSSGGGNPTVPVLGVVGTGPTQADADRLAQVLGIGQQWPWELVDGNITYVDRGSYLVIPVTDGGAGPDDPTGGATTIRHFDYPAISAMSVLPPDQALSRARDLLQQAGLDVAEGVPQASHDQLEVRLPDGTPLLGPKEINTVVSYSFSIGGIPVEGPGARIVMVFDSNGDASMVHYAWREVAAGHEVELLPSSQVMALAATELGTTLDPRGFPAGFSIQGMDLVYYAPPLTTPAQTLYPHYRIRATETVEDGSERGELDVRQIYVPAFTQPLQVSLINAAMIPGDPETGSALQMTAQTLVRNGRPPYDYHWVSSSRYLPHATYHDGNILYEPNPGGRSGNETTETLSVIVTDADGQRAAAEVSLPYPPDATGAIPLPLNGTFAAVWTNSCARLRDAEQNARGLIETMLLGHGETFGFALYERNLWEQDFKDQTIAPTGQDHHWIDNVDLLFYTGHAGKTVLQLCDTTHDDEYVRYSDVRWGDNELEWLISAACGPLYDDSWELWQAAFDGLHILMGYGSRSNDNKVEGRIFATWSHPQSMFGGALNLPAFPVVVSWALAAHGSQPQGKIWSAMGVTGTDGGTSFGDYLWGQGAVSPDLRPGSPFPIDAFWRIKGST